MSTPAEPVVPLSTNGIMQESLLQQRLLAPEPVNVTFDDEIRPDNPPEPEEEEQPTTGSCRDGFFALLFCLHLAAVITLSALWGFPFMTGKDPTDGNTLPSHHHRHYHNETNNTVPSYTMDTTIGTAATATDVLSMSSSFPMMDHASRSLSAATSMVSSLYAALYLVLLLGTAALMVSIVVLGFMARFASTLIQISILFNLMTITVTMVVFASNGQEAAAFAAFAALAVFGCYAWNCWHRIPFASANLTAAITAVRTNIGLVCVPIVMTILLCAYILVWFVAVFGTYRRLHQLECLFWDAVENYGDNDDDNAGTLAYDDDYNGIGSCTSGLANTIFVVFFLFLMWTTQVVTNVIHVTVAGVVGTWWFAPDNASSCCSGSILASFARSTLTSFGSICLGSLLVGVLNVAHQLVNGVRRNRGSNSVLFCLLECILSLLEKLVKIFNKWAYVYVGLYGYAYMDAGTKVTELFATRGWTTIINDRLVGHVLTWMSLVIGGCTGAFGALLSGLVPSLFRVGDVWVTFFLGFVLGGSIAGALMRLVSSGVDTVVVCFAEAPTVFRENHPEHHERMEQAWLDTYPSEYSRTEGSRGGGGGVDEEQDQSPDSFGRDDGDIARIAQV